MELLPIANSVTIVLLLVIVSSYFFINDKKVKKKILRNRKANKNDNGFIIYISGKISGDKNYKEKFDTAEKRLKDLYPSSIILNPAKIELPPNANGWYDYMLVCLNMLKNANMIYMLKDYTQSKGAVIELDFAKELKMPIIYEK